MPCFCHYDHSQLTLPLLRLDHGSCHSLINVLDSILSTLTGKTTQTNTLQSNSVLMFIGLMFIAPFILLKFIKTSKDLSFKWIISLITYLKLIQNILKYLFVNSLKIIINQDKLYLYFIVKIILTSQNSWNGLREPRDSKIIFGK